MVLILKEWRKLKSREFSDDVHGPITIFTPLQHIIDTPEFQRLRNIKQLSFSYLVYPSATHTRFSHSLGTYHLARLLVEHLQELRQTCADYEISSTDMLCISIAALIHDLGHGPFSHHYEKFLKSCGATGFKHEKMSCQIFEYMRRNNKEMDAALRLYLSENDITFINELIDPPKMVINGVWQMKGRPKEKSFLYQIVSNPINGLDVDKIDYLLRDSRHTGISLPAGMNEWKRIQHHISIAQSNHDGLLHLRYSHKVDDLVNRIFDARMEMHKIVYKHKTTMAIEHKMVKVLRAADEHFQIVASVDTYRMSNAYNDIQAFLSLDDGILSRIEHASPGSGLDKAKKLLFEIKCRKFPKLVGILKLDIGVDVSRIEETITRDLLRKDPLLERDDFLVLVASFDRGKGLRLHPMNNVLFCDRNGTEQYHLYKFKEQPGGSLSAFIYVEFDKQILVKKKLENALSALSDDSPIYLIKYIRQDKKRAHVTDEGRENNPEEFEVASDGKRIYLEENTEGDFTSVIFAPK